MSKQLYVYSISPGDTGHLAAFHFISGVVEADPKEIDAIVKEMEVGHVGLLEVKPIDEAKIGIAEFRRDVGRGLVSYHGEEVKSDAPCLEDAPYVEESVRADWSEDDVEGVMREIYHR